MKRTWLLILMMVVLMSSLVLFSACGAKDTGAPTDSTAEDQANTGDASGDRVIPADADPIVISSLNFTENVLLGQMTYDYLKYLGYPVESNLNLGSRGILRAGLKNDEVDLYWEYDGSIAMGEMAAPEPILDPDQCYTAVKDWDEKTNGIIWLDKSDINDTYCFCTRQEILDKYHITKFSEMADLIKNGEHFKMSASPEYQTREDGLPLLEKIYDFSMPREDCVTLSMGLDPEALVNKEIDITELGTTDPKIVKLGLAVLEDDKHAFQNYYAAPIVRADLLETFPNLAEDMKTLSSIFTVTNITEQIAKVDLDQTPEDQVSVAFLKEKGLIK
ncbi:glycine betaine ABC transporter substrate-binding protein [Candidatus Formimonas warabiya]|uniref:ABC-type glycine betaine transport system substrate-binding domain-containing protein n=1 Tax=Formimonas warabiya TaxID=1761012 RepID=A0A3G1KUS9_FORW1|nr:glycine betaine ABC transporter substrate-binding protein [Candidatus Formimonas warabiya]ATW26184.1 hypothetical protein DCMF_16660 [Candidatus Formimonas warabiya]